MNLKPGIGLVAFLLCIGTAGTSRAESTVILPYGATWRYLDDGSDQGTAWRDTAFNDSTWTAGPAQLGYGDGDEATVVGYIDADPGTSGTQKNATTYFRTTFTVASPSQFIALSLSLTYDDAGAIYINGTEVARTSNLAAGAGFNTYATSASSDNASQTWTVPTSALVAGTNTIAVEIHQSGSTSSDVSFDLQLLGLTEVTRGPYLQMNNHAAITLRWRTATATDSIVWTGSAPGALSVNVSDATVTTEHEVRLTGLQADTVYYYAIGSSSGQMSGNAASYFFRTAPTPGTDKATRLWVLGDAGTANSSQQAVRDAYYNSALHQFNDLVLLLGDNAYNTGTDAEYQTALFDMYPTVLRQSPVWSCLGNHETAQATSGSYSGVPYFDLFSFPTTAQCGGQASGTERYFSWDFGNVHFVSLDAQTTNATLRTDMLAWLDNDLAANTRRWTIAIWHHPPYTKGSHDSDTESQLIWARENLVPLMEAGGVDLVLCGHSHSYERSKFIDGFHATPTLADSGTVIDAGDGRETGGGVYGKDYGPHLGAVFAVAGSSGQISGGTLNHPVMLTSLNMLGSMIIDITGNRLDARFISSTGTVADSFSIEKGPVVTVATPTPNAAEYGPVNGQFTVTRSGSTAAPLVVQATIGGSAAGSRYQPIVVPVTIPVGSGTQTVTVTPVPDATFQGSQNVTLTSAPNVSYRLGGAVNGSVTITDTPAGAPPIASWHLAKFGTAANNAALTADTADPDFDGSTNLIEYALGLEPLAPSLIGLPANDTSSGYLKLIIPKNPLATDVSFEVQSNDDPANPLGWSSSTTTILQNTPTLLEVRDNVPISIAPRRFMRLQVSRP
ncbi:MAG: metallophosphoesterase family protein [Verrucomicrobiaceae bacterium]